MYWVIQSNIYEEENYKHLLDNLERCGLQYSVHKAVPFSGGIIDPQPVIPEGVKVIVMGSYSLARYARNRGWLPGAYIENLDYEIQREHWGDRLLNADAQLMPFGDIPFQREPFFVRPTLDTKTYTGLVVDWGEYEKWRDGMRRLPECNDPVNDPLSISVHTLADRTMVCRKKEIWNETRTWVVNGKVVTASGFKVGTLKRYTAPEQVDARITDFASECAQLWSPNRAYVLDVAETEDGLKIGEVNNLNSAGWYRCDMQKLIMSLEELES
jgi:hypothetical protein